MEVRTEGTDPAALDSDFNPQNLLGVPSIPGRRPPPAVAAPRLRGLEEALESL